MATDHGHDSHANGPIHHETTDIHLDGVGKIVIGFTVFMALIIGVMYGTFRFFGGREAAGQRTVGAMVERVPFERPAMIDDPNTIDGTRTPAGPKLLTAEPLYLGGFRAEEARRLNSYGWVDRAGNVVHMPIAKAIELTVARGLPAAADEAPADTATEDVPADATDALTTAPPVPGSDPD